MRLASSALLALAALLVTACEQAPPPPATKPLVVATFYPLYEFSRAVVGDRMEVIALVPPGVEPHDWDPAPQDIAQLQRARVLVFNGGGLEPWVDRLASDLTDTVAVNTTEHIELQAPPPGGHTHDHGHGRKHDHAHDREKHAHGHTGAAEKENHELDPHVWLDPVLAQAQVEAIRAGLTEADPAGAEAYAQNAKAYTERLAALHREFEDGLRQCERRDIVVTHAAFGYLARRYGLRQVPVLGLTPEAEPSPADLARIVRFARQQKVQYIFFETLASPRLAETLAREIGAQTLVLDPVEGLTKDEAAAGKSYLTVMEDNLQNLRTALGCR
jgi:zinc transport system substrate-binding protein